MAEAAAGSGVERAAILLLSLSEETAASILRHMNVDEVQQIGSAMAQVSDVPRDRVTGVLVDAVSDVHRAPEESMMPAQNFEVSSVTDVCRRGEEFISILDPDTALGFQDG